MLNVLSLFSGIGAFEKALTNLGIEHNVLAYCEIDPHASKSYSAIHGIPESMNLKDVTKVDALDVIDRVDLITYGFPCQDISQCGKQKGFNDENGDTTRSGLFFEALRIIDDYRPKFAIAENVKALTSNKFTEEFNIVLSSLEEVGYVNYWAIMNGSDYNIPQSRERVFIVSIRADIDVGYTFPDPIPLTLKLSDVIESGTVDRDVSLCITARYAGNMSCSQDYLRRRYFKKSMTQIVYENTSREEQYNFYKSDPYGKFECQGNVRPFTPSECFKLFGFTSGDCAKCSAVGISDAQLYKQAGNSICVPVAEAIFSSLGERYNEFKANPSPNKPLKVLELFAGTRSIGKVFEERGYEVFSVDWSKDFENIDLYTDIGTLSAEEIINKFGRPDIVWASPDCATFSVAAISYHRQKDKATGNLEPITDYAKFCDEVNQNVLKLIRDLKPKYWFIENPRGGLRSMSYMQGLPRYTVTYCQYGDTRMKPTDIWTNHPQPNFKPPCKNGDTCHVSAPRGSKTGTQALKGSRERAVIPRKLCEHIVNISEDPSV